MISVNVRMGTKICRRVDRKTEMEDLCKFREHRQSSAMDLNTYMNIQHHCSTSAASALILRSLSS